MQQEKKKKCYQQATKEANQPNDIQCAAKGKKLKAKKFRKKKLNKEELKISKELCCFELNTRQLLI